MSEKNVDTPRLHGVFEHPELGLFAFALVLGPAYLAWGGFAAIYCATFAGLMVLTVRNSVADREVFRHQLELNANDPDYDNRRLTFPGQWGYLTGLSGFGPILYAAGYFTVYYLLPDIWNAWEAAMSDVIDWCASMVPNAEIFARTVASRGYPERAPVIKHLVGVGFFIGLLFGTCGVARAAILASYVRLSRHRKAVEFGFLLGGLFVIALGIWAAFYGLKLDWSPGVRHITLHITWASIYYIVGANLLIYIGLVTVIFSSARIIYPRGVAWR